MTDQRPARTNVTLSTRINNLFPLEDLNTSDLIVDKIVSLIETINQNNQEPEQNTEISLTNALDEINNVHAYLDNMPFNPRGTSGLLDRISLYTSTVEFRLEFLEQLIENGKEENRSINSMLEIESAHSRSYSAELNAAARQNDRLRVLINEQQETLENLYELNSRYKETINTYKLMIDEFRNSFLAVEDHAND